MCLFYSEKLTKNYKEKIGRGEVVVYKLVDIEHDGRIRTPYRFKRVRSGTLKSNRRRKELTKTEKISKCVDYGVHVYRSIDCARQNCVDGYYTKTSYVRCIANADDFVAAGEAGEAVFMKIRIPKEELEKTKARIARNHKQVFCQEFFNVPSQSC